MLVPMTSEQKRALSLLMDTPNFKVYLKWLEDSREQTHQRMYTTIDPAVSAFLQGQAKQIFDEVTECYRALTYQADLAFPSVQETPGGTL